MDPLSRFIQQHICAEDVVLFQVSDNSRAQGSHSTLKDLLESAGLEDTIKLTSYNMKAKTACKKAADALNLFCSFQRPQLQVRGIPVQFAAVNTLLSMAMDYCVHGWSFYYN